jgi:septum formation topological specificity factor MinE
MALTRDQIRERLKYAQLTLSNARQNIFASDIAERIKRNIVAIILTTDGTLRYVEIEKVKEDDTYDMFLDNVPVDVATGPQGIVQIPNNYDIENPILVLEGGTNLSFIASAGAPECTVYYWDDEL